MVAKVIDMMDFKSELMQNTGSALCDVVVVISACHGYKYTHGFHCGYGYGLEISNPSKTNTGTRTHSARSGVYCLVLPRLIWSMFLKN
jgi:hypothetical protein